MLMTLDLNTLVAIDVHTHAETDGRGIGSGPLEREGLTV
jgi:hypothetical protein